MRTTTSYPWVNQSRFMEGQRVTMKQKIANRLSDIIRKLFSDDEMAEAVGGYAKLETLQNKPHSNVRARGDVPILLRVLARRYRYHNNGVYLGEAIVLAMLIERGLRDVLADPLFAPIPNEA